ncbi:MAG: hypothetical protein COW18_05515 [Zetaproteobacteria bacterium CG12_big_fil_rev_8_21_14_0_65_54_13]|nr:MAG: hypothetical protein COX55_02630 [Zetaproteobacteria bacterium CG23_combo_of_CG06-09_8_20_14_all_54_7]PIW49443.1 MAG: hypothetical protein COW18_05515 [Zetaproteobacteria bacterium CG12_big_fil_rev_8_21_14_0_65_54_13]PIX53949.1 MAG: hypothetical protein COZ50_10605 [Zetaproteobacteria bacterium CG_4_10_14_3_um_filter_54_28]PJA27656.1 MAG: hypothetical protein CO188_11905 [Zetaproteobacteria bacterium CG_4_9_14_3_um_filter_54_145]
MAERNFTLLAVLAGSALALLFVSSPYLYAAEGETADDLLEIERQIEVQTRMLKLRELQIQRQEQDMRFYQAGMGSNGQPEIVHIPRITLEMIRSHAGQLVAGIRYGNRYLDVRKGDLLDQGVKVADVTVLGVALDVHGSPMQVSLDATSSDESSAQVTEGSRQ